MPMIAAAFVAVGAGTASVAAIATVVSTVGMGLSVVGKLTGSKDLMKIGGVMSLVGGVTSLAAGAMGVAGAASSVAEGAAGAGLEAGATGAMDMGIGGSGVLGDAATSGLGEIAADAATAGLESAGQSSFDAGMSASQASPLPVPDQSQSFLNAQQSQAPQQVTDYSGSQQAATDNAFMKSDVGYGANAPAGTSSAQVKSWWESQPEAVKSAYIQAGTGAVGKLFDGWSAEQKMAFEREKYNLSTSNANAQPSVSFKPVAGVQARPMGGLLNAKRSA